VPYIQNTHDDQTEMLKAIGMNSIKELFDSIPESLRLKGDLNLPEGLSEMEAFQKLNELHDKNRSAAQNPFFLGAGIYHHFIPSLVDHLSGRSEFVTAYTPYQPEVSQGSLQAFFEYQTAICMLTGLEVSNASMYDGATALAEAALMAIDGTRRKQILVSSGVHPEYRKVLKTYLNYLDIEIIEIPCSNGASSFDDIENTISEKSAALILQSPNFFGTIEDLGKAANMAKKHGALSIATVDPISLSVLKPPGELGIDIATGEGQGLGIPLSFGGPGFGFLAARKERIRRLPGRVVGQTTDLDGKPAYVLTFQTREQHIRRERATSNICTNHALMALRSVIYLFAMGRTGFKKLGDIIADRSHKAAEKISAIDGYDLPFAGPFFKEFVVRCPRPASEVNSMLLEKGVIGGYELGKDYPDMENVMLFCVTEMNSSKEIDLLAELLGGIK